VQLSDFVVGASSRRVGFSAAHARLLIDQTFSEQPSTALRGDDWRVAEEHRPAFTRVRCAETGVSPQHSVAGFA